MNAAVLLIMAALYGAGDAREPEAEPNGVFGRARMIEGDKVHLTFRVPEIQIIDSIGVRAGGTRTETRLVEFRSRRQQIELEVADIDMLIAPEDKRVKPTQVAQYLKKSSAVFICVGRAPSPELRKSLKDGTVILVIPDADDDALRPILIE